MSTSKEVGVPIKLLLESESHKVTVEMRSGEVYRGLLTDAESTMNVSLSEVICTARNGKVKKMESVYLKGNGIRLIVLPDMLKHAACVKKISKQAASAVSSSVDNAGGKRKRE